MELLDPFLFSKVQNSKISLYKNVGPKLPCGIKFLHVSHYHVYQQLRVYFKFYSQHPKKGIFAQQNSFDLQALLQYTKKNKVCQL